VPSIYNEASIQLETSGMGKLYHSIYDVTMNANSGKYENKQAFASRNF